MLRVAVQYVRGLVDGKTTKPLISVQFLEAVILRIKKCHLTFTILIINYKYKPSVLIYFFTQQIF